MAEVDQHLSDAPAKTLAPFLHQNLMTSHHSHVHQPQTNYPQSTQDLSSSTAATHHPTPPHTSTSTYPPILPPSPQPPQSSSTPPPQSSLSPQPLSLLPNHATKALPPLLLLHLRQPPLLIKQALRPPPRPSSSRKHCHQLLEDGLYRADGEREFGGC